jgi:hypothetical protein
MNKVSSLQELLRQGVVYRPRLQTHHESAVIDTGYQRLNQWLPPKGWPQQALIELIAPYMGCGEIQLLLPALRRVQQAGGLVFLLNPPAVPYPQSWQHQHIALEQLWWIDVADQPENLWWVAEQVCQTDIQSILLIWPAHEHGLHQPTVQRGTRRLQAALRGSQTLAFVLHACSPSPLKDSQLRLTLSSQLNAHDVRSLHLEMHKCKGFPIANQPCILPLEYGYV